MAPELPETHLDRAVDLRLQRALLRVLSGELRGREFPLGRGSFTIGKSEGCDLVLRDGSVSRSHAEIRYEQGRYHIVDFDSTNGTFINEARVDSGQLTPGEIVRIGRVMLHFLPWEGGGSGELLPSDADRFGPVLGQGLAMRRLFSVLERVARSELSILFTGEGGSGKSLLARAVHDASGRRDAPFVVLDCLEPDAAQLEAALFGGVGGLGGPEGALQRAAGGSLYLDGVDGLPTQLRARLWHQLDRGLGDLRVLASGSEAAEETPDLDGVFPIVCPVPPLRERREDIPTLIEHFSRRLPPHLWTAPSAEAMARLVAYTWPGNVRELRNVVSRSAYLGAAQIPPAKPEGQAEFDMTMSFAEHKSRVVEGFESSYLDFILRRCRGNVSRAAREAGMDRKHLHTLLKRYGLSAKSYVKD